MMKEDDRERERERERVRTNKVAPSEFLSHVIKLITVDVTKHTTAKKMDDQQHKEETATKRSQPKNEGPSQKRKRGKGSTDKRLTFLVSIAKEKLPLLLHKSSSSSSSGLHHLRSPSLLIPFSLCN
jgi:hypothetical protein